MNELYTLTNNDFPRAAFDTLAQEFGFADNENVEEAYTHLCLATIEYGRFNYMDEEQQRKSEFQAEKHLKRIEATALKLSQLIEESYEHSDGRLMYSSEGIAVREESALDEIESPKNAPGLYGGDPPGPTDPRYFSINSPSETPPPEYPHIAFTEDHIRKGPKLIATLARYRREGLPPRKPGARKSLPLQEWAADCRYIWQGILGKPFTIDWHDGKAVSDAARFTVTALQAIEPDVNETKLITAMRNLT